MYADKYHDYDLSNVVYCVLLGFVRHNRWQPDGVWDLTIGMSSVQPDYYAVCTNSGSTF